MASQMPPHPADNTFISPVKSALHLAAWVGGGVLFSAAMFNGLALLVTTNPEVIGSSKSAFPLGYQNPAAWVCYFLMGALFGSMMWFTLTPPTKPRERPLPPMLAFVRKWSFLFTTGGAIVAMMGLLREFTWGSLAACTVTVLVVNGLIYGMKGGRKDQQQRVARVITRTDLANRLDKCVDAYLASLPKKRGDNLNEFPFLETIYSITKLVIKQNGNWPIAYAEYSSGSLRVIARFIKNFEDRKLKIHDLDRIAAMTDAVRQIAAAQQEFDTEKASTAVAICESLFFGGATQPAFPDPASV